uniref:F-box domain-containing protein n=1 Tax=Chenopodium quinoa TaxID=63459 RepID=A0A803KNX2_CHEQI
MKMMSLNELPEDCVSTILSLSSPWDVCRSAAACSELRSVAQLDCVWESFLPVDYHEIVSRAGPALLKWDSKKELFFLLCNSLLIDGGNKVQGKYGTKNHIMVRYTRLFKLNMLSPNTTYGAYLIFKVSKRAYGLEIMPMEVSIEVGSDVVSHNTVYLRQDEGKKHQMQWLLYYNRTEILTSRVNHGSEESNLKLPGARGDGWMEIELGHFFCGDSYRDGKVVKMSMTEIKGHHLMGGLIVEGIEIRPLQGRCQFFS